MLDRIFFNLQETVRLVLEALYDDEAVTDEERDHLYQVIKMLASDEQWQEFLDKDPT